MNCFVKSQLPRRESKRSNHPLAHHNNILNAIETRLSLLKMTYCKYVQYNVCCFIPGKVIDELFRVLNLVNGTQGSPIPHEILTELRDISSMAMDYFEEKIVPNLQKTLSSQKQLSACSSSVVPDAQSSHRSGHASSSPCGEAGSSQDGVDRSSLSSYITGGGSYFSFTDNLLDLEMRSAFDILTAPSRNAEPAGFNSGSMMLVPVPAETLKALVAALKETKAKKNKLERSLSLLQTKVITIY
ncbi:hypothetical protein HAZT_HAZT001231 [Hyalella azteca]|uniref:Uncharacterized protein n=1 Tax=Hyalella azteca TaxID=294128 RepID=A0A6A0GYE8_HYAAZ|nr:hypothetical protein HAZT_HAZT001231 [Hyalella azteca]